MIVYSLREQIALAVYGSDETEGWVDTLDFTTASEEVQQTCRAVADAVLAITEADKAAALEDERHATSGRIRDARIAGRIQALREAESELRRLAAEAGIAVDTTKEES